MSTHTFGVTGSDPFGIATADFVLKGIAPSETYTPSSRTMALASTFPPPEERGRQTTIDATYGSVVITAVSAIEITAGSAAGGAGVRHRLTNKGTHATGTARGHSHVGGELQPQRHHADLDHPSFAGSWRIGVRFDFGRSRGQPPSSSYTIELGHTDEDDKDGNFWPAPATARSTDLRGRGRNGLVNALGWVLAYDKTPDASNVESNTGPCAAGRPS